jgi:glycosyltransferase involved in cell wall biosynthesis
MILRDEQDFLSGCLESVKDIVDEIIVVDTGSADRTKEIAAGFGASVFDFKWNDDFSAARNFSLSKASSNWILVLDADELVGEDGKKEILELVNTPEHCLKDVVGFKLDQRTYFLKDGAEAVITADEAVLANNYGAHKSSKLVRLFKNNPVIRFRNKVHELVEHSIREVGGEIIDTPVVLHHFSQTRKDRLHEKTEDYTDIIWKQLEQEPDNPRYNKQVAVAFMGKGRYDLALKYFTRTLKLDPKYPGLLADMGKAYLKMNDIKKAMKLFNMAIAMDKNDISSMNNLAVLYMGLGKYGVAKQILDKALEKEPDNKYVLGNYKKLKKKL